MVIGTGTTNFQERRQLRHIEMFNSFFSDSAMLSAVYLNILSEIATTLTTSLVEVQ